jgi:hypothetical protein
MEVIELDASDFISKPFELNELGGKNKPDYSRAEPPGRVRAAFNSR